MWIKTSRALGAVLILGAGQVCAETPLSAIDWLSDSIAETPSALPASAPADIAENAMPEDVSISALGGSTPDAVGLLPTNVTGLPGDLWGSSSSADLAGRFRADRIDLYPAMQDLLYTLLLAELDPPIDTGPEATLFLARIDTLLALGALDQAQALLAQSGQDQPQLFRRAFDVSLLLRTEDDACETLRAIPALSPTFPARIFCLARGGDWNAAALSLEIGRGLGYLSEDEDALLARFLDPSLFEDGPRLIPPARPSPLVFRIHEAIGEPLPTANMPRAFAHSDLQYNSGWKAQLEAAERLTRTGALDPNLLLGLYNERRPAASGGLWDRVQAVQSLAAAFAAKDRDAIAAALPIAWREMSQAELEVPFARLFSERLEIELFQTESAALVFEVAMLSEDYESAASMYSPADDRQRLLQAIAQGSAGNIRSNDPMMAAIQDGFRAHGIPVRLQSLTREGRLGSAILRAMELFANGTRGDTDQLADALAFFRAVGLEDTARRAALQLIVLERRG